MAIAKYWQKGDKIDYKNTTEQTIKSNQVLTLGERIGIAGNDILPGETGTVVLSGVFVIPKADSIAIKVGNTLYFATDKVTPTKTGNVIAGMAVADAAENSTEAIVRLV